MWKFIWVYFKSEKGIVCQKSCLLFTSLPAVLLNITCKSIPFCPSIPAATTTQCTSTTAYWTGDMYIFELDSRLGKLWLFECFISPRYMSTCCETGSSQNYNYIGISHLCVSMQFATQYTEITFLLIDFPFAWRLWWFLLLFDVLNCF